MSNPTEPGFHFPEGWPLPGPLTPEEADDFRQLFGGIVSRESQCCGGQCTPDDDHTATVSINVTITETANGLNVEGRHPSVAHFGSMFAWGHLPTHLAETSGVLANTAQHLVDTLPDGPELSAALRKLLEAKDCAVRAKVLAGA